MVTKLQKIDERLNELENEQITFLDQTVMDFEIYLTKSLGEVKQTDIMKDFIEKKGIQVELTRLVDECKFLLEEKCALQQTES
jgi:hypothetical protein